MSQNLDLQQVPKGQLLQKEAGQYLTFSVAGENYGIDIMMVREIKGWTSVTRLPNSPEYLCGVMNLRGVIVPIFDLNCRFSGKRAEVTTNSVIIILAVADRNIGVLVDSVSDILDVSQEDIKPAPHMDNKENQEFITGLISLDSRMVVILDMHHVFDNSDIVSSTQQVMS